MPTPKPKKLLFVLLSLSGGGAEKVASILLNHLNRDKFKITLVLFNKEGEYLNRIPTDIPIIEFGKKSRWDFFNLILQLRKIIIHEHADVVFSLLCYTNIVTILASRFLRKNVRIIISEQNIPELTSLYSKLGHLKSMLANFTYKKATKIIVVSYGIKKSLINKFKTSEINIHVIYNPFEIEKVVALSNSPIDFPVSDFGTVKKIISVGRLTKVKNHKLLIESFSILRQSIPAILLILGQGDLKEELEKYTHYQGVSNYVYFLGFKDNPFAWMKNSDLFVLTSECEGFGNVIIEAMACKTPVISTDCPYGPGEIIESGKNGLLVPGNNKNILAESMAKLLSDGDLIKNIREEGFRTAQKYDIANIIPMYERVFSDALSTDR